MIKQTNSKNKCNYINLIQYNYFWLRQKLMKWQPVTVHLSMFPKSALSSSFIIILAQIFKLTQNCSDYCVH